MSNPTAYLSPPTAYLLPNGESLTTGEGPALSLQVATVEGVVTLNRPDPEAPWVQTEHLLADRHIGSLLMEPGSGRLFAGAHAWGGLWVSDDGRGAAWRPLDQGLDRPHICTLAARRLAGKVTLFLGASSAPLYRSEDLGESWTEITSLLEVPDTDKWTFPPPPHIPHVKFINFHPGDPQTLFVGVEQGGLFKSTDDGESWTPIPILMSWPIVICTAC
ncbi:MAG: hypothetical protein QGF09_03735 [Rhodospirillales bacterium]|nr:hypothetical protein [Rhodospirillales bacterium]